MRSAIASLTVLLVVGLLGGCTAPIESEEVTAATESEEVTAPTESEEVTAPTESEEVTAEFIIEQLDENCPGCGPDAYTGEYLPHAMAFGLLASTAKLAEDETLLRASGDWLISNSQPSIDTFGWGLGFEWDAFGDGTVNPASTIYGITTALGVRGLLDAYETSGATEYLESAVSALDYYRAFKTETKDGLYFWYSDREADAVDTNNITAMLAGQYARAGALTGNAEFSATAKLAVDHLLANQRTVDGLTYWPYSISHPRPNDAVHAAYIVQGLIDYSLASGAEIDLEGPHSYLRTFSSSEGVLEFSPIHDLGQGEVPRARLWGVGMLMYTLTELGDIDAAAQVAEVLPDYLNETQTELLNLPGSKDPSEPRMTAHVALALARMNR